VPYSLALFHFVHAAEGWWDCDNCSLISPYCSEYQFQTWQFSSLDKIPQVANFSIDGRRIGELLSLQQDMDYHVLACAQLQVSVSYWCTDITYRWGCQWETHWTVCTAEMLKPWDDDLKHRNVDLKLGNVIFQDDGSFARLPGNSLSISEYANMSNDGEEGSPSEEESEFSDDGDEKDDAAHQGLGFSESAQFTSIHLMIAMVLVWILMGLLAGSAFSCLYKMFKGSGWKKITLQTAFLCPQSFLLGSLQIWMKVGKFMDMGSSWETP
jgi:hypothetical protein